jgi:hypothetical protein
MNKEAEIAKGIVLFKTLNIKDGTMLNYKAKLAKIIDLGLDWKSTVPVILKWFKSREDEGINTILSYLNIVYVLRKASKKGILQISKYRETLFKEVSSNQTERQTIIKL